MKTALFLAVNRGRPVVRMDREQQALVAAGWETRTVGLIPSKFTPIGHPLRRALEFRAMTNRLVKGTMELMAESDAFHETVIQKQKCRCLDSEADLIVAHDLDTLPAGVRISGELNLPLIYDAHEDWPLMIRNNSWFESKMSKIIEENCLDRVEHVVTAAPMPRFERLGVPTTVLYNARPTSQIERAWPADRHRDRGVLGYDDDDFVVGYAGNLEQYRGIADLLLDLLGALPERFKFLIVGGPKEVADDILRRWGTGTDDGSDANRLLVTGYLSYEKLAPYFSAMDMGLVLMDDRPNHRESLPNKLFDYMAHGIPVIAPDGKYIGPVVRGEAGYGRNGWLVDSMTQDELLETLNYAEAYPKERRIYGEDGRRAYEEVYSWDKLAPKFVKICEDLI